mgnify:FL=1
MTRERKVGTVTKEPSAAKNIFESKRALMDEQVYQENIEFWEKAWGMVARPYKQLPQLSYVPRIPDELKQRRVGSVLDLGCGSGWLSIYLAQHGFQVTGVDVSAQAINLGKIWAEEDNIDVNFDVMDIANLDYGEGVFDGVVANSIFEHFPMDLAMPMAESVRSMLKPGGIFLGCFDNVGGGPGEYYTLADGTHVYTDKGRKGMLLRRYSNEELEQLFGGFSSLLVEEVDAGSRFVIAIKSI